MTYVLGTAAATGAPPRLQFTCADDDLASLGRAYGVSPQAIWNMQPKGGGSGLPMERQPVQAFVKALPGWTRDDGMHKFDANLNPGTSGPDGKPEGFAHFTANTQLMLPDMPRLDGKQPRGGVKLPVVDVSEAGMGIGALLFGAAAIALLAFGGKKKPKSTGVSK